MFYTEEDVQPIVDAVTEVMGVTGNMAIGKNVLPNVTVSTPEFGKVWYGDYTGTVEQLNTNMTNLSTKLGYKLSFEINQI